MAFLFIGGEAEDFSDRFNVATGNNASPFARSTYARQSVLMSGALDGYAGASFTAGTNLFLTFRKDAVTQWGTNPFLSLRSAGGSKLRLRGSSSASTTTIILEKFDGTTATTLATSTLSVTTSVNYKFDVAVDYGTSGRVRLWVDQTLYIDYSGNVTVTGVTSLDGFRLYASASSTSYQATFSEVIVTDGEDTRPLSLKTLVPNATGDVTGWTSGTYAEIDDNTVDTIDVAVSETANQILAVNCTGMPTGASGLTVRAVKSVAYACRGSTGPSKLALGLRQSSTNGFATGQTLDTGYGTVSATWTTNPVTSAAFTGAEIDAVQLAYRSET